MQANRFVCILKRIVSFSHCYQITDCDLPAPCNGWCGFEIRPQLSLRTLSCLHIRVFFAERDNLSVPWGAKTEWLGPSDTRSAVWNLGNGAAPLLCPPHGGGVISELCLFVGTLSCKPSHQLHVNLVSKLLYDISFQTPISTT